MEGLTSKTKVFYNNIINLNPSVFFLCESWHKNEISVPIINNCYEIFEDFGSREKAKGRLMKGFILGIKKEPAKKCTIKKSTSEYCILEIKDDYRCIWVIFLYLSPSSITTPNKSLAAISPHNPLIILGDLNSRLGDFRPSHSTYSRRAKDKITIARGKTLITVINNHQLSILNGCSTSDKYRAYAFVNKNGSSCNLH
jgi:hypothetical protein